MRTIDCRDFTPAPAIRSVVGSAVVHIVAIASIFWLVSSCAVTPMLEAETEPFTLIPEREIDESVTDVTGIDFRIPKTVTPTRAQPAIRETARRPALARAPATQPHPRSEPKQQMTIDEFRKLHPPKTQPSKPDSTRPLAVAHVDVARLDTIPTATSTNASVSNAEQDDFAAQVRRKLREAYAASGGVDAGLAAQVVFWLRVDGTVARAEIAVSSGDPVFDQSVLNTFKKLRVTNPPRPFVGRPLRIPFRTRTEE